MDSLHWWRQGDAVTQATALLLLAMSVASWVVIVWKLLFLRRARGDVARCMAAFWQAPLVGGGAANPGFFGPRSAGAADGCSDPFHHR